MEAHLWKPASCWIVPRCWGCLNTEPALHGAVCGRWFEHQANTVTAAVENLVHSSNSLDSTIWECWSIKPYLGTEYSTLKQVSRSTMYVDWITSLQASIEQQHENKLVSWSATCTCRLLYFSALREEECLRSLNALRLTSSVWRQQTKQLQCYSRYLAESSLQRLSFRMKPNPTLHPTSCK